MRVHELDMLIQTQIMGASNLALISMSQEEFDQSGIRTLGRLMGTDDAEAVRTKFQELKKKYPVTPGHLIPELDELIRRGHEQSKS